MRSVRFRTIGLLLAAVLLIALASYSMIRKTCCAEELGAEEIRELERAATSGNVPAMKRLYFFFDESEQPEKAAVWLRKAADAGDAEAELHMFSSLNGSADPEQKRTAMTYLHRAAEHGSSTAQATLAQRYRDGAGVSKNIETARSWFQKAARAGNHDAILALCDMAAAARDIPQCEECLVLQTRALESLPPKSYRASQFQEQRERIKRVVNDAAVR